jgi:D-beta-D-heptose 7-phosphate kinase/D-beta-D-heptose 1-phosphate adenosyltransferase
MLDLYKLKNSKSRILVIGDIVVDEYFYCESSRISPEAPVMILNTLSSEKRLGGAANVYNNLKSLGADASIVSVIGIDENTSFLTSNLEGTLLLESERINPLKRRFISKNQQIIRIDTEKVQSIKLETELLSEIFKIGKNFDCIILSDYAKGVFSENLIREVIEFCRINSIPVLVDPKGIDFSKYSGATLLTPNKLEAAIALGIDCINNHNLEYAIRKLKKEFDLKFGIITLSEDGIALLDKNMEIVPSIAEEVYDVTGAGDTVIAALAIGISNNLDIKDACIFANFAASVSVKKFGNATVKFEEIIHLNSTMSKIVDIEILTGVIQNKHKGQKIIFTNGCFDILHFGHIRYLEKSKKLGDVLIVGLNSDESVKSLKGNNRPINKQNERVTVLAALSFIDYIVIFEDLDPYNLIKQIKPDILVKGADYEGKEVIGSELVNEVVLMPFEQGYSTSSIINKISSNII